MPSHMVYICDRCSRRFEAGFESGWIGPGWCSIDVQHGFEADRVDESELPDMDSYVLCGECSPVALVALRSSVGGAGASH